MGINGLLQILKGYLVEKNIKDYYGQKVAVDTYSWLHKGLFICNEKLFQIVFNDKYNELFKKLINLEDDLKTLDIPTKIDIVNKYFLNFPPINELYLEYSLKKIDFLSSNNIKIVLVFDGAPLTSKFKTEEQRQKSRDQAKKKAIELYEKASGKKLMESIDLTLEMAYKLIQKVRNNNNCEWIVSPYEADAQLAYLSKINYVDLIICEDSDLLAFGAQKVFYKLDNNGLGKEMCLNSIFKLEDFNKTGALNFINWTPNMFLTACILSGCDYLDSLRSIGPKTAFKLVSQFTTFKNIITHLKMEGKIQIPQNYEEEFCKAFLCFKFQRVFCPFKKEMITLNNMNLDLLKEKIEINKTINEIIDAFQLEEIELFIIKKLIELKNFDFLGQEINNIIIREIAYGNINPVTHEPYEIFELEEFKNFNFSRNKFKKNKNLQLNLYGMNKNKLPQRYGVSKPKLSNSYKAKSQTKIEKFFRKDSIQLKKPFKIPSLKQEIKNEENVNSNYYCLNNFGNKKRKREDIDNDSKIILKVDKPVNLDNFDNFSFNKKKNEKYNQNDCLKSNYFEKKNNNYQKNDLFINKFELKQINTNNVKEKLNNSKIFKQEEESNKLNSNEKTKINELLNFDNICDYVFKNNIDIKKFQI